VFLNVIHAKNGTKVKVTLIFKAYLRTIFHFHSMLMFRTRSNGVM